MGICVDAFIGGLLYPIWNIFRLRVSARLSGPGNGPVHAGPGAGPNARPNARARACPGVPHARTKRSKRRPARVILIFGQPGVNKFADSGPGFPARAVADEPAFHVAQRLHNVHSRVQIGPQLNFALSHGMLLPAVQRQRNDHGQRALALSQRLNLPLRLRPSLNLPLPLSLTLYLALRLALRLRPDLRPDNGV